MHGIDEYEGAVLELLTEYSIQGLSEQMLWQTIRRDKGHPRDLIFKAFKTLESKDYIMRIGNRSWYRVTQTKKPRVSVIKLHTLIAYSINIPTQRSLPLHHDFLLPPYLSNLILDGQKENREKTPR